MNYSKYDTYDINDDPEIPYLDWEEEQLRCRIEKTRRKGIYNCISKLAALHIKLAELNHPDFVDREVRNMRTRDSRTHSF